MQRDTNEWNARLLAGTLRTIAPELIVAVDGATVAVGLPDDYESEPGVWDVAATATAISPRVWKITPNPMLRAPYIMDTWSDHVARELVEWAS